SAAARDAEDTERRVSAAAKSGLDWANTNARPRPTALSTALANTDPNWIPRSYSEAMTRPDLWKTPMDEEIARMEERKVWTLVERPTGAQTMKN
ncbi:hypothetical protein C0991_002359, partial [Blastosporella zonata]